MSGASKSRRDCWNWAWLPARSSDCPSTLLSALSSPPLMSPAVSGRIHSLSFKLEPSDNWCCVGGNTCPRNSQLVEMCSKHTVMFGDSLGACITVGHYCPAVEILRSPHSVQEGCHDDIDLLCVSYTEAEKHLRPSAGLRERCFAFPLYGGGNQGTEMLSDRTLQG